MVRLRDSSGLTLLVGLPDGDFADAISLRTIGKPSDIHVADLDGDGRAEILAANRTTDSLTLLRSVGGSFVTSFLALPIGTAPDSIQTADTDRDGTLELVVGGGAANTVTAVEVDENLKLSVGSPFPVDLNPVPDTPVFLQVADFGGNGWADFVLADAGSGELAYFEASGCGSDALFRRGDVTQDGVLNVSDGIVTLEYLFVGGRTIACPDAADVDDDGHIALNDAALVLNYLFASGEPPALPGPDQCGPDVFPDELKVYAGPCP